MTVPPTYGGPYHPPSAPMPQFRPISVGEMLNETFRVFRAGFGKFIGLGAIVGFGIAAMQGLAYWLFAERFLVGVTNLQFSGVITAPLFAIAVVTLLAYLLQAQVGAVIVHVANGVSDRRATGIGTALAASRTVVPRVLVPVLLVSVGAWLIPAGFVSAFQAVIGQVRGSDPSAAAGSLLIMLLALLVVITAWIVLATLAAVRFFLFLPVVATENGSGFAALGRSWRLTRGVSWRVYAGLILVGLINWVASLPANFFFPTSAQLDPMGLGGIQDVLAVLLPGIVAAVVWSGVVTMFVFPLVTIMSGVVYRHQTRSWLPVVPYGYPGYGSGNTWT